MAQRKDGLLVEGWDRPGSEGVGRRGEVAGVRRLLGGDGTPRRTSLKVCVCVWNDLNIVWLDFKKYGKLTGSDLNDTCELLSLFLSIKPEKTVGIVLAPYLTSQRGSMLSKRLQKRYRWLQTLTHESLEHFVRQNIAGFTGLQCSKQGS